MSRLPGHLFFRRVRLRPGGSYFSLELGPGLHSVVLESEEEAQGFVSAAVGLSEPDRGRVTWGRLRPTHEPRLRGTLGSLLAQEPLSFASLRTKEALAHVLALRHELGVASMKDVTEIPLVQTLLDQPYARLTPAERRRVALGLAMALSEPSSLVLHDPFDGLEPMDLSRVSEWITSCAKEGIVVACTTLSERAARRISKQVHHLCAVERGGSTVHFLLRAERPREIASFLSADPAIVATRIPPSAAPTLLVEAIDEIAGAEAITRVICSTGVDVFELRRVSHSRGTVA